MGLSGRGWVPKILPLCAIFTPEDLSLRRAKINQSSPIFIFLAISIKLFLTQISSTINLNQSSSLQRDWETTCTNYILNLWSAECILKLQYRTMGESSSLDVELSAALSKVGATITPSVLSKCEFFVDVDHRLLQVESE